MTLLNTVPSEEIVGALKEEEEEEPNTHLCASQSDEYFLDLLAQRAAQVKSKSLWCDRDFIFFFLVTEAAEDSGCASAHLTTVRTCVSQRDGNTSCFPPGVG